MNLAILHYHLNRGGVTRVVENQLRALDAVLDPAEPWRVALVYGGRAEGFDDRLPETLQNVQLSRHTVASLEYDQLRSTATLDDELSALFGQIGFAPETTVLHVHNHTLGKNVLLPGALSRLAMAGYPLVLQIHDFPEDFRPTNYRHLREGLNIDDEARLAGLLYPQARQIHYAVLNGRDWSILRSAGLADGQLHRLPNPVPAIDDLPSKADARGRLSERFGVSPDERFLLYPVRGIRRKNLGETLLWAAMAPSGTVLGLTLRPLNRTEVPIYEDWKRTAAQLNLPCRFELGAPSGLSFAENLAAADSILTTSLAEGFGMVFLESWLAGRPLLGRDLPEITRDFTELDVHLPWLGACLKVPVDWVGPDAFRQVMLEAYRRTVEVYGRTEPDGLLDKLQAKMDDDLVDFGDLNETLQQEVLAMVAGSREHRQEILRHNPWVEKAFSLTEHDASQVVQRNAQAIAGYFSSVPSGRRLLDLYRQASASPRDAQLQELPDPDRILTEFLDFDRFRPIRS